MPALKRPASADSKKTGGFQPLKKPAAADKAANASEAEDSKKDEWAPLPENKAELERVLNDPNVKPIDKKLAKFRAAVSPDEDAASMFQKMKKFFEPGEMSTLWGRFGTLVNNSSSDSKLAMQVMRPQKWQSFLAQESNTLTRKVAKQVQRKRYYKGELIRIHGQEEFDDFLARGKFEETEDSDGDVCYYKKEKSEVDTLELTREARTHKTQKSATGDAVDALSAAFKAEYSGKAASKEALADRKAKKDKKEKKEKKEDTPEEKLAKSLKSAAAALTRLQGQLMAAIANLAKEKMASSIRTVCVNTLEKVKELQSTATVLDTGNAKTAEKFLKQVQKVVADAGEALKKAKPFNK